MLTTLLRRPRSDQRGLSMSTFVALLVPMMLLVAGLAVDGSAHARAVADAQVAAHEASRAGQDAAARVRVDGASGVSEARAAAAASLSRQGVHGDVVVDADRVRVTTRVQVPTTFLSIIGIDLLTGRGSADAVLVAS